MYSTCSLSNLTPEQRAAGKRVAIVYMIVKGLQSVLLIALMVFLTTSDKYRPWLTAIWCSATVVLGLLGGRICMASIKHIETGKWPRKSPASWVWDFVLIALLSAMLILSW